MSFTLDITDPDQTRVECSSCDWHGAWDGDLFVAADQGLAPTLTDHQRVCALLPPSKPWPSTTDREQPLWNQTPPAGPTQVELRTGTTTITVTIDETTRGDSPQ